MGLIEVPETDLPQVIKGTGVTPKVSRESLAVSPRRVAFLFGRKLPPTADHQYSLTYWIH